MTSPELLTAPNTLFGLGVGAYLAATGHVSGVAYDGNGWDFYTSYSYNGWLAVTIGDVVVYL